MTAQLGLLAPTEAELRAEETRPPAWALMHGRYQDCLDVECDALISDCPFSDRTHKGHDSVVSIEGRAALGYAAWTPSDVIEFVDFWHPRTRGWFVTLTDHVLFPVWEDRLKHHGRYTFAPIPVIDVGMSFRYLGDGPSNWTVWMLVARRRTAAARKWRTLPGMYQRERGDQKSKRKGGKPLGTMRAIVRDYSNPGDLVCDPCAGEATTLRAALAEGRSAVGAEVDRDAYEAGHALLAPGPLFSRVPPGSEEPSADLPAAPGWTP